MKNRFFSSLYSLVGIILILAAWYLGSELIPRSVPPIGRVLSNIFFEFKSSYLSTIIITVQTSALALLISFFVAFFLVYLVSLSKNIEFILSPILVFLKATPIVAFIPIIISVYGYSMSGRILTAIIICIVPLIIAGIDGMKRRPKKLSILANVYGTSNGINFIEIKSVYALESMCSALKFAAPLSLVGTTVSEFLVGGSDLGIGCTIASNLGPTGILTRYSMIIFCSIIGIFYYYLAYFIHFLYVKSHNFNK